MALFVQRTQAMLPGFQLTIENAGDIAAICTRLEGVPLAIELAAEQCYILPPKALRSRGVAPARDGTEHHTVSSLVDRIGTCTACKSGTVPESSYRRPMIHVIVNSLVGVTCGG